MTNRDFHHHRLGLLALALLAGLVTFSLGSLPRSAPVQAQTTPNLVEVQLVEYEIQIVKPRLRQT